MAITEPCDLTEVLSRLDYWQQDPAIEANRGYRRFSIRGEASISTSSAKHSLDPALNVLLRDVGRGGISFLSEQSLQLGSSWRIALQKHGLYIAAIPIVICYCRKVQEGLYLVGTQFVVDAFVLHNLGIDLAELEDDIVPHDETEESCCMFPARDDFVEPAAISE